MMREQTTRIAFVGTFPPTQCGIATFTESLCNATGSRAVDRQHGRHISTMVDAGVIRLVDDATAELADDVVANWVPDNADSLRAAARVANRYSSLVLQHEFGIFGGVDGEDVLDFLDLVRVPTVVVLHTVLAEPTPNQRNIIEEMFADGAIVVVQTQAARTRLLRTHDVNASQLVVIPHGAAANFSGSVRSLTRLDAPVVLTWGLVGPGKGIEHGISAIAELAHRGGPVPVYLVAGQTHPTVLANDGERYRLSLLELASDLGVREHVAFDSAYRDWPSLREIVRSSDVVLLPYDSREQVTSGVLVEAIASGRPVVATKFPHAVEVLEDGAGIVVPHEDPVAIADALEEILGNTGRRQEMERQARIAAAGGLWPRVGAEYLSLVRTLSDELAAA